MRPTDFTLGDIVLVRIGGSDDQPALRPGIIVMDFQTVKNICLFADPLNDEKRFDETFMLRTHLGTSGRVCYSIPMGTGIGEWRARRG